MDDLLAVDVEFGFLEGREEFEGLDAYRDENVDVAVLGYVSAGDAAMDYGGDVVFAQDFEEVAGFLALFSEEFPLGGWVDDLSDVGVDEGFLSHFSFRLASRFL